MTVLFQFSVLPKARQVHLHFGEFSYKIYKTCVRFFFEGIVVRSREADHISCCWSEKKKQISWTHFLFFKKHEYEIKEELVLTVFVISFDSLHLLCYFDFPPVTKNSHAIQWITCNDNNVCLGHLCWLFTIA